MNKELPKLLPVSILLTSYNRLNLLKKTIDLINERTFYPFRIIVIDNNSTDGSVSYLKNAKVVGKIFDHILLPTNIGQSQALNHGFAAIEKWENELRRPSSDFFVTTNDDIFPPMLGQENCWLTQMIKILEKHEPEFGGICMRIQRTPRNEIDESKDIIECFKGFPSVFRLMRRSDYRKLGDRPFGRLLKWDSNSSGEKFKTQLKKKFGFTTYIYADHAGFITNSGYDKDVETFTVAANKVNISDEKPYPDIDPLTNVPIKINHPCDTVEQQKREDYQELLKNGIKEPEVTIIVLTCKRPEGLRRAMESIRGKTSDIDYKLLVVADNDDTEAYNYCIEQNIDCILVSKRRDFVAQANLAISAVQTPYFAKFDDDQEVIDNQWLKNGLEIFKTRFPDSNGLLCFNDGISNGAVWTTGISSKKFVYNIGGNMFYPKFIHFGGDRETVRLVKEMGLYHYEESIKINHYHPSKGTAEKDETYKFSEDYAFKSDQDLKHNRQKNINILEVKNYCDYL